MFRLQWELPGEINIHVWRPHSRRIAIKMRSNSLYIASSLTSSVSLCIKRYVVVRKNKHEVGNNYLEEINCSGISFLTRKQPFIVDLAPSITFCIISQPHFFPLEIKIKLINIDNPLTGVSGV